MDLGEREKAVYLAKLAEQAERYDGASSFNAPYSFHSFKRIHVPLHYAPPIIAALMELVCVYVCDGDN